MSYTPEKIEERIQHLLTLQDGWNGEGSKAIDPKSAERCRQFLRITGLTEGFAIFPTEEGYLKLEWTYGLTPSAPDRWWAELEFCGDLQNRGDELWVLNADD